MSDLSQQFDDDDEPLDTLVVVDPTLALLVLAVVGVVGFLLGCVAMAAVS